MGRYRVIVTVIALLTVAAMGSASAGDARNQGPERLEPQRFDLRINNGVRPDPQRSDSQHRFHRTQVIVVPQTTYVIQRQCASPGYWAYEWIPQTYSYNSWVASQYAPDGAWVDGHYEPRYYNSGYYQPYWVDAAAC